MNQAEIDSFTETGKTVVHRGRTFDILNPPPREHRADSPYILRSRPKRGPVRYYALMRNVPKPTALFGVSLYDNRMSVLPGWFSDATGELVSVG
jgi:hypothetical protein